MEVQMVETKAMGPELVDIPIGTFRHYISFIATHDLWDEATAALAAKGIKSVLIGAPQMLAVRQFMADKGPALNALPDHAGALVVPECGHDCRPVAPKSPFPDGGVSQPFPEDPPPR
jgi:hypothetical protein